MSEPWLSVIMPTYNGTAYLGRALESICAQAAEGVEVVAVDDGSTDATLDILNAYAGRLSLRLVRRPHVGNWVANTNYGLTLARGAYACFLHQDDLWMPHRLAALRRVIVERAPTLLLHPAWFVDTADRRVGVWRCPLPTRPGFVNTALVRERLLVQNFIAVSAPLFKRDAALRVGGMDNELWYTADWDLWLKLSAAGPVCYVPRPLSAFRLHPLSQTVQGSSRLVEFRRQMERVLDRHGATGNASDGNAEVVSVARFSIELNTALAACMHGAKANWRSLARRLTQLGPTGWHRFLRDSRIRERVGARLRVARSLRLMPKPAGEPAA